MNYKLIREKYNLTRDDMAQLLGLTLRTIGSYETEKMMPSVVVRNIYMIMDSTTAPSARLLGAHTMLKRGGAFHAFKRILEGALA